MNLTGGIVLYAVIWFLVLFVLLPIGQRSQAEAGEVVPGTPAGAPDNPRLKRKMLWATLISAVLWGPAYPAGSVETVCNCRPSWPED